MITGIKQKGLRLLFEKNNAKALPPAFVDKIGRALLALSSKPLPQMVDLPGFGLHPLTGDRKGTWSIVISGNYRITFKIRADGTEAYDLDFEDYH